MWGGAQPGDETKPQEAFEQAVINRNTVNQTEYLLSYDWL